MRGILTGCRVKNDLPPAPSPGNRLRWLAPVFAWLILIGMARPAFAETLTLEAYRARIEAAAERLAADAGKAVLDDVRRDLAGVDGVTLDSGDTLVVRPLLEGVTDPAVARARLTTVAEQLRLASSDDLSARQAAMSAILARPGFGGETLQQRIWRWIEEWLQRVLPTPPDAFDSPAATRIGSVAEWGVVTLGLLIIILLLGYWVQRLVRAFVGDVSLNRRFAGDSDEPRTSAEAREQAASQAAAGSYRSAVRSLYLSALLLLEENELVASDRSLTNRELLARTGSEMGVREALRPVVETFDSVWYGVREPDATHFADYEAQVSRLRATVERAEPGAPQ